jgi:hypothetical protein
MEAGVGEADGNFARRLMRDSIADHPSKDSYLWYLRSRVADGDEGYDITDTLIDPKISPLEDKEGKLHDQAIQDGDMKITVNGSTVITTGNTLVTKDDDGNEVNEWSVFYVTPVKNHGIVQERRCFVRPKNKDVT